MELGELKPFLRGLFLPPAGLLFTLLVGWALQRSSAIKLRATGSLLVLASGLFLWFMCCLGAAAWLSRTVLPQLNALSAAQVAGLKASGVQGIIVLGGGVEAQREEYQDQPQLLENSSSRLRYGVWLARQTGLPVGFSGGVGWQAEQPAASGQAPPSEAATAQATALADYGIALRWVEAQSRDTRENAQFMQALLAPQGVHHIALVTHASHMPRAERLFVKAGFQVTPAPMGFTKDKPSWVLQWLPSADGMLASRAVLYELAGSLLY